ncbi:MAG: exopolysaccharide biosynthesis polyprenyl glycosylphosphotransferase [Candidatus Tectomicrobia bacterium]|nr:exopolysaccharide biosynthesis polyprenyl glycosylphosphotransferase [Candidatus Tectomicrobia bacterium]
MWNLQFSTLRDREISTAFEVVSLPVPEAVREAAWPLWWPRVARIAVLLLTDIVALLVSASLGYLFWAQPVLDQPSSIYVDLVPLILLFPLGYAGAGLYPGFGVGAVETLRRFSYCTSFAFLVLAAASFVLKLPPHYSRMTFAIAWSASLILVPLLHFLVLSVIGRLWREPAVLVGSGRRWVQGAIRALENGLSLGYRPVGVLSLDLSWHGRTVEGVQVLGGPEFAPYLAERGVCVALVEESDEGSSTLSWLQQHFRHVVMIREYKDLPVELVRVCNLGGVLGIEFTNNLLRWQNRFIKRTLDVVLGAILLLFALPLIALGGLLVKLLNRGPIFFCQEREVLGGCPIKVWKLRTMYQDAERRLEEFLSTNPELRREWEEHFKLARDPRVIPGVGTFLRRFSVDELPQLWNIVKGDMSLVGPRPLPDYHLKEFPPEFLEFRRQVRPGLTGMWQIMVRSNGGIEEQKVYDTYYIRNWSGWLDLWIILQTAWAVLVGKGAY